VFSAYNKSSTAPHQHNMHSAPPPQAFHSPSILQKNEFIICQAPFSTFSLHPTHTYLFIHHWRLGQAQRIGDSPLWVSSTASSENSISFFSLFFPLLQRLIKGLTVFTHKQEMITSKDVLDKNNTSK